MNTEKYKTSDLYFASFLKTVGVPLLGTEVEGKKIFFIFNDSGTIKELKKELADKISSLERMASDYRKSLGSFDN